MKYLFLVFGLLVHSALAIRKNSRGGRDLHYSSRGSEKSLFTDKEIATMQVRRRAYHVKGKGGKGGKGKSGGGYTVMNGPFDNTQLDGDALDAQGVNTDQGTPLDTGFPAEELAVINQAEIDAMEEEGPDHDDTPGKSKDYDDAADSNGAWEGGYSETVNDEDADGEETTGSETVDGEDADGGDETGTEDTGGTTGDTVAEETGDIEAGDTGTLDGDGDSDTTGESSGVLYGQSDSDTLSESDGSDPNTNSAECKVTDPDIESLEVLDLAGAPITYFYTVSIDDGSNLKGCLEEIELKILQALVGIMACSTVRRLEATGGTAQRRLDTSSALKITSDPDDEPTNDSKYECTGGACRQILIKGGVTAYSPEGANLSQLSCDFLPVINDAIENMDVTDIDGLTTIEPQSTELPDQCLDNSGNASVNAKNSPQDSELVPAGVVVGAAVGGMCLVLLGLLVVRQRMVSKRREENGSILTKETSSPGEKSALELTVDANDTQTTTGHYLTPRATDSNDSTVLGISASPDDCSEWGDGKGPSKIDDDDDDIETPMHSSPAPDPTPDPSDITFGDEETVSPMTTASQDPPTSGPQVVPFHPNVHEEEHITHDVDLVRDENGNLRDGLAEA